MTKLIVFKTSDGQIHTNHDAAVKHADKRYGDELTAIAHRLVQIEKYSKMTEFLESNLDEFRRLLALRDDIRLEEETGDAN
jgi:hypothetical protein